MNTNENGRSMVEMLGVLVIMAVTAIASISAIKYAINKAKSDKILHTVTLMALTGYHQLMTGQELNLSEFGDEIEGYPMTWGIYGTDDCRFVVELKGPLPQAIRKNFLEASFNMPFLWLVKDGTAYNCYITEGSPNNFFFFFVAPFGVCRYMVNVCFYARERCQKEGKELDYTTTAVSGAVCK